MLRKIEKEDYNEICKLLIRAFKKPPWNETWDYNRAYQRVEQLDDGNYTRCYAYLLDNQIVGVICGKIVTYVNDVDFMIEDFYIDPDYQRMGIGQKMMELAEKELSEIDNFTLLTGRDFCSVDFYKKSGFVIKNEIVFMYKKLSENKSS